MDDSRLERIETKIDRIAQTQAKQAERITTTMMMHKANSESLKEHMRRTRASELRLDVIERVKYYVVGALLLASLLSSVFGQWAGKLLEILGP